jgi:hypothetical protein
MKSNKRINRVKDEKETKKVMKCKKIERNNYLVEDNFNQFLVEVNEMKSTIPNWNRIFAAKTADDWIRLKIVGNSLVDKYSWAIPNDQALNIISQFSPIVEIGSGKGYWASLLRKIGVDILCYDLHIPDETWTQVLKGGPKVIKFLNQKKYDVKYLLII